MSSSESAATRLILIRHGQIQANVDKRWHGSTDSPLTDEGRQQALRAGRYLKDRYPGIHSVYCSPLQRTRHTAEAIGNEFKLEAVANPGLAEYGIGVLEGETFEDLASKHDFFSLVKNDPHYAPPEGESLLQVENRVSRALMDIAGNHPGQDVVVVSHGAAMALGLARLIHNDPYAWHNYRFHNTGMTKLEMGPSVNMVYFNQTLHLEIDIQES